MMLQGNEIDTLVLDFDGTLYWDDGSGYTDNIWLPVHKKLIRILYESERLSDNDVMEKVTKYRRRAKIVGYSLAHREMGGDQETFDGLAHGAERAPHLSYNKDLKKLFEDLSQKIRVIIFTGAYHREAEKGLEKLLGGPFEGFVDGILGTDDIQKYGKPDIEAYHFLIETFGIDSSSTLMVDDQFSEIESAKRVGFKTIAVGEKMTKEQRAQADAYISHILELREAISGM